MKSNLLFIGIMVYVGCGEKKETETDSASITMETTIQQPTCQAQSDAYTETLEWEWDMENSQYDVLYRQDQLGFPWIVGPIVDGLNNTPLLTENGLFCPGENLAFDTVLVKRTFAGGQDSVKKNVIETNCSAQTDGYYEDIGLSFDMTGDTRFDVFYREDQLGFPWIAGPIVSGLNNTPLLTEQGIFCPGEDKAFEVRVIEWTFSDDVLDSENLSTDVFTTECQPQSDGYYEELDLDFDQTGDVQYDTYYREDQLGFPWIAGPIVSGLNNTPLLTERGIYCPGDNKAFEVTVVTRQFN